MSQVGFCRVWYQFDSPEAVGKIFCFALLAHCSFLCLAMLGRAGAEKIPRVGFLTRKYRSRKASDLLADSSDGLRRACGIVEGKTSSSNSATWPREQNSYRLLRC